MSNYRSIQASMWLMILLQTVGAIDPPGKGPRKLPAPRNYIAIIVVWATLFLADDADHGREASAVGWVLVATSMMVQFTATGGNTLLTIFNSVANNFKNSPTPASTTVSGNQTVTA